MATFVIGDVQGCYDALCCLMEKIAFDPDRDMLWFAGDLVNRGPKSLDTLRLIRSLDAKVVLGNHDLHLLACAYASHPRAPKKKDTLREVLEAPDAPELLEWLRKQPLMLWDRARNCVMTHAGIPPSWSTAKAFALSQEVQAALNSEQVSAYFDDMYGNQPDIWSESLMGTARLRVITNYFTRMRFLSPEGNLEFAAKESVETAPSGFKPWFDYPCERKEVQYFGHWAALEGVTHHPSIHAVDTGCVWKGALTAMDVDTGVRIACKCASDLV